jgi:uncharacterized protein YndB with AHSA1/START domain
MKKRTSQHATFVIERKYPVPPDRVFAAWANPAAKARWFSGSGAWRSEGHELDFRIGGREHVNTVAPGEAAHRYDGEYRDIVPGQRIVYCYDMYIGDARISVSLASVEFVAEGTGTRMTFTEQAVFLDGYDDAGARERGSQALLEKLAASLDDE